MLLDADAIFLPADDINHFSVYDPRMLMQKRVQALLVLGLYSVVLRETIELGRMRRPQGELS